MRVTDNGVPVQELVEVVKQAIKAANVSSSSPASDLRIGSVRLLSPCDLDAFLWWRPELSHPADRNGSEARRQYHQARRPRDRNRPSPAPSGQAARTTRR